MPTPLEEYRRRLDSGEFKADRAQQKAIHALDRLHRDLVQEGTARRGWRHALARLTRKNTRAPQGVYLWGQVGRGKTRLMDLFYDGLPFADKERRHFHRFMADVHTALKHFREHEDPLELVAEQLAEHTRVICFDELAVTDITDAMILSNLFSALFARGVTLAMTSNIKPADLYAEGLQRDRFLPAIRLIETHMQIVHVGGDHDYRLGFLETAAVYLDANAPGTRAELQILFERVAGRPGAAAGSLDVLGRPITYLRQSDGVVWFDFKAICDGPRSQNDHIELSKHFHTVLISNIPQFTQNLENQARRFIAVVDEFYDRRVNLIVSAAVALPDLYAGQRLAMPFARTRSRLREMQSRKYLAAKHR